VLNSGCRNAPPDRGAMVVRVSWRSFSSRVMTSLLAGFEDQGIVIEERQGVGGELIQLGVAELERRLYRAWRSDLAQEVSHIISAKRAGGQGFLRRFGDLFGTVSAEQIEQLVKLAEERAVGVSEPAQIALHGLLGTEAAEPGEQALLSAAATRARTVIEQLFFEALDADGLTATPGTRMADEFVSLRIVERDRRRIGLRRLGA